MAFCGQSHIRYKVVIDNEIIEQINDFNYFRCNVSYCNKEDINFKLNRFERMCKAV